MMTTSQWHDDDYGNDRSRPSTTQPVTLPPDDLSECYYCRQLDRGNSVLLKLDLTSIAHQQGKEPPKAGGHGWMGTPEP